MIIPKEGVADTYEFDEWKVQVKNGYFDYIPEINELPEKYRVLSDDFITCRIFRWAIRYFYS
ncbi:hypothetical protein [Clostridium sp.]|uniref:hypothetical protein n=1 Tax=Clostridium sp. TaxID=1506 RepID=UPI003F36E0A5